MHLIRRNIDKRIAVIILLYFSISLTNVALKNEIEWFPLFSFKLFSRIPGDFTKYDIVFDKGTANERYLLYGNHDLSILEHHSYQRWLASPDPKNFDITAHEDLFSNVNSASLVKFSGSLIDAAKDSRFNTEVVLVIK